MYDNIGEKIKGLAKVIGILLLIAGIIAWFILITNTYEYRGYERYVKADDYIGWISLVAGVFSYISSWFLYGFGQLIEDTATICQHVVERDMRRPAINNRPSYTSGGNASSTETYIPSWLKDPEKQSTECTAFCSRISES